MLVDSKFMLIMVLLLSVDRFWMFQFGSYDLNSGDLNLTQV